MNSSDWHNNPVTSLERYITDLGGQPTRQWKTTIIEFEAPDTKLADRLRRSGYTLVAAWPDRQRHAFGVLMPQDLLTPPSTRPLR